MTYTVGFTRRAQRELDALPAEVSRRILAAVDGLEQNARPPGCLKLAGGDSWRIRVGDYRVIYDVDDAAQRVTVAHVAHRREVYR